MTKILLIEDEELVARMYEKALKFEGYEVAVAFGGKTGLEKVGNFKPDLVLLDIMMPEPDGIEVLERIKANPETSPLPVIMLTNLSGKRDAQLALEKGALDYIVKSKITLSDLAEKIKFHIHEKEKSENK